MGNDYLLLPQKFHKDHKFCSLMVDEIESFIISDVFMGLKIQILNFDGKELLQENEHILDYLLRTNQKGFHDKHLKNHILYALLIDSVSFLKEAMEASAKMRLTVTFSLLRKPFVYNMVVVLRLFFTSDFLDKFNLEENFDTTNLTKEDLKELLNLSTEVLLTKSISGNDIYDFVFNKGEADSLINISNQALHPSTTRNKNNSTGIQNINFVFSTEKEIITQWEYLYGLLKVLLIYLNEVLDYIVFTQLELEDKLYTERITNRVENIYPKD